MLAILNQCIITDNNDFDTAHEFTAIIITDTKLHVTTSKYSWLMDKTERSIEVARSQLMTDLVDVEHIDETTFIITFLDEIREQKEKWHCVFETNSCLQNTFAAIAQSWEKLFKVPLSN